MMAPSSRGQCLVSMESQLTDDPWRKLFKECIEAAGLEMINYSSGAVKDASCMLAFPNGDDKVVYHMAFSMGRNLPVLLIVEASDTEVAYEPPPKRIPVTLPSGAEVPESKKNEISTALLDLATPPGPSTPQQRAPTEYKRTVRAGTSGRGFLITNAEHAEQLLQECLAVEMTKEPIRQLLTDAGVPQPWLKVRLFEHFGGW